MRRVFFDANILLDQLDSTRRGHDEVRELEIVIEKTGAQILCAWHSLSIIEYVGKKVFSQEVLHEVLQGLVRHYVIPKTGNEEANQAFAYLGDDYEDAMQVAAAVAGNADFFVTHDKKGFSKCPMEVLNPKECVKRLLGC